MYLSNLYICKHIIGLAIRLTSLTKVKSEMPLTAISIPIGHRRKPGRPALAKPALIKQNQFQFNSIQFYKLMMTVMNLMMNLMMILMETLIF